MIRRDSLSILTLLTLLALLPLAIARSHESYADSTSDMGPSEAAGMTALSNSTFPVMVNLTSAISQSYFSYPHFSGLILAHIVLMTIAWVFILPIGKAYLQHLVKISRTDTTLVSVVMLSLARYRLALVAQLCFLGVHSGGVLLGTLYSGKTPDLYKNNAHSKIDWLVTGVVIAQTFTGVIKLYASGGKPQEEHVEEESAFLPIADASMQHYQRTVEMRVPEEYRYSRDSGQGTEPDSPRDTSISSLCDDSSEEPSPFHQSQHVDADLEYHEKHNALRISTFNRIAKILSGMMSKRALKLINITHDMVNYSILLLGFAAITSGIVVYAGVFRGNSVFNGLAHFVKGGIFFWYGLLTLGRWMGCFAEIGWAWNLRPQVGMVSKRKAAMPSAEFVESFVIFLYGSTNIFLEHLAAWGSVWSAQDLEHVAITIMFLGGGLVSFALVRTILRLPSLTKS